MCTSVPHSPPHPHSSTCNYEAKNQPGFDSMREAQAGCSSTGCMKMVVMLTMMLQCGYLKQFSTNSMRLS
jgi:hypothetical protein